MNDNGDGPNTDSIELVRLPFSYSSITPSVLLHAAVQVIDLTNCRSCQRRFRLEKQFLWMRV